MRFEEQLSVLLKNCEQPHIREDLFARICLMERALSRKQKRHYAALWSGAALLASVLLIPLSRSIYSGMLASGFSEYVSLFFSDTGAVVTYWQDVFFALSESIPTFEFAAFLTLASLLLYSARHLVTLVRVREGELSTFTHSYTL